MDILGESSVPDRGPLIVVSNHRSLLDGLVLFSVFDVRVTRFMVAAYICNMPVIGSILKFAGVIPANKVGIKEIRKTLSSSSEILKKNGILIIFPEGGVRTGKNIRKVESGASYLAVKTKTRVLPVYISGTGHIMPRGSFFPRGGHISVSLGDMIDAGDNKNELNKKIIDILNFMGHTQTNTSKENL